MLKKERTKYPKHVSLFSGLYNSKRKSFGLLPHSNTQLRDHTMLSPASAEISALDHQDLHRPGGLNEKKISRKGYLLFQWQVIFFQVIFYKILPSITRTPGNSNLFQFPLKVWVIGSRL